jgi:hypothetical protein
MTTPEHWLAQLKTADLSAALEAAENLGRVGGPLAVEALQTRFGDYQGSMSSHTPAEQHFFFSLTLILAALGHYQAYRLVVDEDAPFVRPRVAALLRRVGRERAIQAAQAMLTSAAPDERYWAAQILAALR